VAANYRAANRARSEAEFYAKICIVVEECDETQFWLDYLLRINFLSVEECAGVVQETGELVKIFTAIKKKMKDKLSAK
jgi:four helix bundle protein